MVHELQGEHRSEWAAIVSIAASVPPAKAGVLSATRRVRQGGVTHTNGPMGKPGWFSYFGLALCGHSLLYLLTRGGDCLRGAP